MRVSFIKTLAFTAGIGLALAGMAHAGQLAAPGPGWHWGRCTTTAAGSVACSDPQPDASRAGAALNCAGNPWRCQQPHSDGYWYGSAWVDCTGRGNCPPPGGYYPYQPPVYLYRQPSLGWELHRLFGGHHHHHHRH